MTSTLMAIWSLPWAEWCQFRSTSCRAQGRGWAALCAGPALPCRSAAPPGITKTRTPPALHRHRDLASAPTCTAITASKRYNWREGFPFFDLWNNFMWVRMAWHCWTISYNTILIDATTKQQCSDTLESLHSWFSKREFAASNHTCCIVHSHQWKRRSSCDT